jgi:hypothetical protein
MEEEKTLYPGVKTKLTSRYLPVWLIIITENHPYSLKVTIK